MKKDFRLVDDVTAESETGASGGATAQQRLRWQLAGGPGWNKDVLLPGTLVLIITTLTVCIYYLYHPYAELTADTPGYMEFVRQLRTTGNPINVFRLPTYPLFILLITLLAGPNNLLAVSIVQGILYILATLECYLLAYLIFGRAWLAFVLSLLLATNVILISYSKLLMTEGLSLWLLMTSLLLALRLLQSGDGRLFKWLALCLGLLFFTRPEWAAFPVLLYAYLLWMHYRRGQLRPILMRAMLSLALLYTLLGPMWLATTL
ncbi:glycosyltransferase family 39 protein [Dictyobacter kobayashii]|uniref:glycosyltransferase family 39 protein n=1 Tax=Dictyobacter kobayashii TaxID=2014872 RepID=UPI001386EB0F|nr:glycosyltransferase family 39 protein [Dictyobacter kobayashii]